MKSSKTRGFLVLTGVIALSIFLSSGCKNMLGADNTTLPAQPSSPPEPVVVDGVRTSYADVVEKVAPAVVKITSERKEKAQTLQMPQMPFPFGGGGDNAP